MISQIQQLETNQLRYHLPVEEMLKEVAKVTGSAQYQTYDGYLTVIQSYLGTLHQPYGRSAHRG
ncbi:MAG: hypothetical protein M9911_11135 [Saprospiraceae bacterium]|nr:hypothetical protein [Saprospiraceae bacterium]